MTPPTYAPARSNTPVWLILIILCIVFAPILILFALGVFGLGVTVAIGPIVLLANEPRSGRSTSGVSSSSPSWRGPSTKHATK